MAAKFPGQGPSATSTPMPKPREREDREATPRMATEPPRVSEPFLSCFQVGRLANFAFGVYRFSPPDQLIVLLDFCKW